MACKLLFNRIMRYLKPLAFCSFLCGAALYPRFSSAQLPALPTDAQPTAEALKAVLAQQKTISDNQAKIDEKLAAIAENLRVARLYSSRIK